MSNIDGKDPDHIEVEASTEEKEADAKDASVVTIPAAKTGSDSSVEKRERSQINNNEDNLDSSSTKTEIEEMDQLSDLEENNSGNATAENGNGV